MRKKKLLNCLISASFLLSLFIAPIPKDGYFITMLVLGCVILGFGIFNYVIGHDEFIEDHKILYLIFFYLAVVSFGTNLILLGLIVL